MKKHKRSYINIAVIVLLLMVLAGLFLIYYLVRNTRDSIGRAEEEHLMDLADTADSNIANRLEEIIKELRAAINTDEYREAERSYFEEGDTGKMSQAFKNSMLFRTGATYEMRARENGKQICVFSEGPSRVYDFSYQEPNSIITDNNNDGCLVISTVSPFSSIEYTAFVPIRLILADVAGPALTDGSGVMLLDGNTGILVRGESSDLYTEALSLDEEIRESEVFRIACDFENQGVSGIGACRVRDENGNERLWEVSVIPSSKSRNGSFAIGVFVDYTSVIERIVSLTWRAVLITVLIVTGLCGQFLLFILFNRRSRESEREIAELNKINRESEEAIRHSQDLEQRERLETIGVLTSSIAHEFNNLLTPIMGYSVMMLSDLNTENEEFSENLSAIYNASSRAKQLISRLTSFSRKSTERRMEYISPDTVLDDVRMMVKPAVPGDVRISYDLNCPECCICGDRMQLIQMFLNLEINAFQAMQEKGGLLSVGTEEKEQSIIVTISDTGTGIRAEDIPVIFEPFYTTKENSGTGLGLPITKRIADSHNAEISVESCLGKGTVFTVIFPKNAKPEEMS